MSRSNQSYYKSRISKKNKSVRSYVDREFNVDENHNNDSMSFKPKRNDNYYEENASLFGSNQVAPWLRPYDQQHNLDSDNAASDKRHRKDKMRSPKAAAFIFFSFLIIAGLEIGLNKKDLIASISERPLGDLLRGETETAKKGDSESDTDADTDADAAAEFLGGKEQNDTESLLGEGDGNYTNIKEIDKKEIDITKPNLDVYGQPIVIPPELAYIADISEPLQENEIALFWHVPRSGGSTIKDIAAFCLDLTQASEVGITLDPNAATADKTIEVIDPNTGAKFMNVDTTTLPGIERAKATNIAADPNVDLIVSPFLYDCAKLFNFVNRGRMITLFRHPIGKI